MDCLVSGVFEYRYVNPDAGERCHVSLLDLYRSKLPVGFSRDAFYFRPLANTPSSPTRRRTRKSWLHSRGWKTQGLLFLDAPLLMSICRKTVGGYASIVVLL